MLYLLAGIDAQNNNLDEVILLNESGRILETGMSNIFLVSGNAVFTPGIDQGCIPGIMRRFIIGLASRAGFRVNDQSSLTPAAMEDAEEVFLTNAIEGIRWVGAYRQRRYYNKTAKQLAAKLNDVAFKG
jgi:branched-chain amino acid aminotransferase